MMKDTGVGLNCTHTWSLGPFPTPLSAGHYSPVSLVSLPDFQSSVSGSWCQLVLFMTLLQSSNKLSTIHLASFTSTVNSYGHVEAFLLSLAVVMWCADNSEVTLSKYLWCVTVHRVRFRDHYRSPCNFQFNNELYLSRWYVLQTSTQGYSGTISSRRQ